MTHRFCIPKYLFIGLQNHAPRQSTVNKVRADFQGLFQEQLAVSVRGKLGPWDEPAADGAVTSVLPAMQTLQMEYVDGYISKGCNKQDEFIKLLWNATKITKRAFDSSCNVI